MGLNYYADMKDAPISDLLRQANIKTKNQLMALSDSSWQYFPYTVISTGAYNIFNHVGTIDHGTHVSLPVSKSSAESHCNAECTAGMDLEHFRMLIHEPLNKDTYIASEEVPIIILDSKSTVCMAKNGKDTNYTRYVVRRVNFVRNG